MKMLTMVVGLLIAGTGLLGIAAPSVLFDLGRSLQTTASLYAFALVRVLLGVVLLFPPRTSRMPRALRLIGIIMIIAGLITPLFGVERIHEVVDWWSGQGPVMSRAWAGVVVALGLFIIYAAGSPRRHAA
jgi:hypothetical protein